MLIADSAFRRTGEISPRRGGRDDFHVSCSGNSKGPDSKCASELTSLLRTADTSYVSSLPTASSRYTTPGPTSRPNSAFNRRGGGENIPGTVRRGSARGTGRGRRGSGLARARPRGAR